MLGAAFAQALGDRAGITRFGDAAVPMDESIATAVVDMGGRPYAVIDLPFRGERIGELPTQLVEHALESFARTAGATIHRARLGPQRPPSRRGGVQSAGTRVPGRMRARSAAWRRARVDEGHAFVSRPAGPRIAVVDYGAGNLVSIDQGLRAVGADVILVRTPDALEGADGLVVPGVGAARPAMNRLRRQGLSNRSSIGRAPIGRTSGSASGSSCCSRPARRTGRAPSVCSRGARVRLEDAPRLPHIGWNQVEWRRPDAPDPLFDGIADGANFYFVHSYAGRPEPASAPEIVVAETAHGGRFASAVRHGNVFGVQFHPERSGRDGLRLLANFVRTFESVSLPLREEVAA